MITSSSRGCLLLHECRSRGQELNLVGFSSVAEKKTLLCTLSSLFCNVPWLYRWSHVIVCMSQEECSDCAPIVSSLLTNFTSPFAHPFAIRCAGKVADSRHQLARCQSLLAERSAEAASLCAEVATLRAAGSGLGELHITPHLKHASFIIARICNLAAQSLIEQQSSACTEVEIIPTT